MMTRNVDHMNTRMSISITSSKTCRIALAMVSCKICIHCQEVKRGSSGQGDDLSYIMKQINGFQLKTWWWTSCPPLLHEGMYLLTSPALSLTSHTCTHYLTHWYNGKAWMYHEEENQAQHDDQDDGARKDWIRGLLRGVRARKGEGENEDSGSEDQSTQRGSFIVDSILNNLFWIRFFWNCKNHDTFIWIDAGLMDWCSSIFTAQFPPGTIFDQIHLQAQQLFSSVMKVHQVV
jgi:hypothetical protein